MKKMRFLSFLFLLVTSLGITSCDDSEGEKMPTEETMQSTDDMDAGEATMDEAPEESHENVEEMAE